MEEDNWDLSGHTSTIPTTKQADLSKNFVADVALEGLLGCV